MSENPSRKRLGRGLAALIGDIDIPDSTVLIEAEAHRQAQSQTDKGSAGGAEKYLPIEKIMRNTHNPRRSFAEENIADLAQSIREHGLVQPVIVRPSPIRDGYFELIAGERRWRAAQQAGLVEIPVLLRDVDDRTALELAIIENVQRADLNPVEEALGYKQLIEEHGYLQADLAVIIGKSRSHLANMMRLLKLPEDVLDKLALGQLSVGHARCLINIEKASVLAQQIIEKGLSVRQAEELAAHNSDKSEKSAPEKPEKDPNTVALERNLGERLGMQVAINFKSKGGDIRIHYKNLDQLDDICRRLEQR
ncbi:MAG: ParB/RepB/Spo0J family partition protein [Candidatus Tokpelaia sp.]|nr:MAG: ParB/RepB/Spo0J family partition protein [Candidatus Tokpelaia sp.]KAA6206005.1 MAG: ParB/RepB/Spo0J family partition protein [Candidatus Tokpelaia sp.]